MKRLALCVALALGACSQSHDEDAGEPLDGNLPGDAGAHVDPVQFCTTRETYACARDLAAGRRQIDRAR